MDQIQGILETVKDSHGNTCFLARLKKCAFGQFSILKIRWGENITQEIYIYIFFDIDIFCSEFFFKLSSISSFSFRAQDTELQSRELYMAYQFTCTVLEVISETVFMNKMW